MVGMFVESIRSATFQPPMRLSRQRVEDFAIAEIKRKAEQCVTVAEWTHDHILTLDICLWTGYGRILRWKGSAFTHRQCQSA